MAKKKHKPIPLSGATKILRAHSTQIDPPGLLELENLFVSRSDNAITLRSDWEAAYAGMFSYASLIQGSDQDDYLNSAFYVTRAGHTIWLGRWNPFTWSTGDFGQMFTLYEEGTITTDGVKKEAIGTSTEWHQKVWPGCLIQFKGEGNNLYVIDDVTNDTRILTNAVMPVSSAAEYQIFRVHPATRAEWPMRLAALGGYLIYGTVDMSQPVIEKEISGPFFANINRPSLGVWFGSTPDVDDVDAALSSLSVGGDTKWTRDSTRNVKYRQPIVVAADKGSIFTRDPAELSFATDDRFAYITPTRAVDLGDRETFNFVRSKVGTNGWFRALSLEGGVVDFRPTREEASRGGYRFVFGEVLEGKEKYEPFGNVALYGFIYDDVDGVEYIFGANGILGKDDGTTYATGIDVALRDGTSWEGLSGEFTHVFVGDDDGVDAVVLTWTDVNPPPNALTRQTSGVSGESLTSVVYSRFNTRLVAVGTAGTCVTSDDRGVTWTSRSVGTSEDLTAVACDLSGRMCVAVGEKVFYSLDGITWEEYDLSVDLVDVTYNVNDGQFYALDAEDNVWRIRIIAYIGSGVSTDLGEFGTDSDFVCDLQHDGSQFVAVGNQIWTSPDAVTWTERETPSETMVSVAKNEKDGVTWVAVGVAGAIYRSTDDGVTWRSVSSGTSNHLNSVLWDGDSNYDLNFIAVGDNGTVLKSPDGETWGAMNFPVNTDLNSITFSGRYSVWGDTATLWIVGADQKIYWSTSRQVGAYDTWQEWAYKPDTYPRLGSSIISTAHYNQVIVADGNKINSFDTVDDYLDGERASVDITQAYSIVSGGHYNGSNSFCVFNRSSEKGLVPAVIVYCYKTFKNVINYLTSLDGGISWSREQATLPYGQIFNNYTYYPVSLNARNYLPICHDGTDLFIAIGSNYQSRQPQIVKHSGWVISLEEAEVI